MSLHNDGLGNLSRTRKKVRTLRQDNEKLEGSVDLRPMV